MRADPSPPPSKSQPKLGIIAGGGRLPCDLIDTCVKTHRSVFVIAIEGQTDPSCVHDVPHVWVKAGQIGKVLCLLKTHDVQQLVLAGYYHRPSWSTLGLDFRGAQWLAKAITHVGTDDGLLRLVIQEFEKEGFQVIGAHSLLGAQYKVPQGPLGRHCPSQEDWISIDRGREVLSVLGTVDVAQSIVVHEGTVVGIEAMEGTDALMRRCVGLYPSHKGAVLVKGVKPFQDRRVDMPVIGEKTIKTALECGMKGIAVQQDAVILLDREIVLREADQGGLFMVGIPFPLPLEKDS